MSSPTQHSLAHYRKLGYTCQVVEHFNSFSHRRVDLFGYIDIVAIKDGETGVLGIQTTSKANMGARILKVKQEPIAKIWLAGGNRIYVDGWQKNKVGRYELTQYEVTPENIFVNGNS